MCIFRDFLQRSEKYWKVFTALMLLLSPNGPSTWVLWLYQWLFFGFWPFLGSNWPFWAQKWTKNVILKKIISKLALNWVFYSKINLIRLPEHSQYPKLSWKTTNTSRIDHFHDFQFWAVLAHFYPIGCSVRAVPGASLEGLVGTWG